MLMLMLIADAQDDEWVIINYQPLYLFDIDFLPTREFPNYPKKKKNNHLGTKLYWDSIVSW